MKKYKLKEHPDYCVEFYRTYRGQVVCGLGVDANGTIINWPPYFKNFGGKQIAPVLNGLRNSGWIIQKLEIKK
jgi:hypothetical protein